MESRNSYDYSAYSDTLSLLCAFKPEAPSAPSTSILNSDVIIDWVEPVTNGWPITSYQIYIREGSSTVFTQESVECDGTSADVIANSVCSVSLFNLIIAPYNLVKGESIYAKIVATNFYGDSPFSLAGNGAETQLVPDAPINLANNELLTDAFSIALTWEEGPSDGGTAVVDYRLWVALGDAAFEEMAANVVNKYYSTEFTLQAGGNYKFKV